MTFRCLLTRTAVKPGIATLCNFYPTIMLGCMHKEFICFWGCFVSLLEKMDPQSRQLHPHTVEANRATQVVVSFAKLPKCLEISRPSVYPSSRYLFHTWSKPVRVTNASHYEILKPLWSGWKLCNSNLGSASVAITQFLPLPLGFLNLVVTHIRSLTTPKVIVWLLHMFYDWMSLITGLKWTGTKLDSQK